MNTRPVVPDDTSHKSAMELSMIIDDADQRRNVLGRGRKSSLVAWETSLEDVLEDEDGEEWEEESVMEGTVLEAEGDEEEEEEEDKTIEEEKKVTVFHNMRGGIRGHTMDVCEGCGGH